MITAIFDVPETETLWAIKGCGCADGRKQRIYKTKEETSAPTVSVELLFLSCSINAKEHQKDVTCNIPGAFMQQADIDKKVLHVHLEGPLAQLLTKVDPDLYTKFLSKESGKDVMYVKLANMAPCRQRCYFGRT